MTIEKVKRPRKGRSRRFVFSRAFIAELADLGPAELERWIGHLPIGFFYELAAAIDTQREIAQAQALKMVRQAIGAHVPPIGIKDSPPRPIHRPRRSPAD